jgi:uncharacterized protein with NAD-binding domain and iron-sulfur cluster
VSDTDTVDAPRRVAILGGGMAAMAAAWRLSSPEHRDRISSVTVYQRGWRLGGKGASGRGRNGRIEEHGLHVWLGYYDNAFRIMRECYGEIDRPTTDPDCPIRTWRDAFAPAPTVGLGIHDEDGWHQWTATFSPNDQLPGEPVDRAVPMSPTEFVTRALRLLADFARSLAQPATEPSTSIRRGTVLSASPTLATPRGDPAASLPTAWAQATELVAAGALEALLAAEATLRGGALAGSDTGPLTDVLAAMDGWRDQLRGSVTQRPARRRAFELVDLLVTCLRGVAADGLLVDSRGFRAIDGEEFRDWLSRHGAQSGTADSPLVMGAYDLAFAYHLGDPDQPMLSAGTGLYMSALMYFGYRGSIFWKMQAGMGDIVFAPLYQALVERGVRFEFYSRVDELRPDETGGRLDTVVIGRQCDPAGRPDPLVRVKGLPCFPSASSPEDAGLERTHGRRDDVGATELRVGRDVDDVVFALPIGMVDEVCAPLVANDRRWRDMVRQIGTVATQAAQLWLREDESDLGLVAPGVTMTAHVKPFDTLSSMTHLLPVEDWPDEDAPRSVWYLCSTMRAEDEPDGVEGVRAALVRHLDRHLADAAPRVAGSDGFRWELLAGSGDAVGPDRIDGQFVVANTDPSERYTQSLPGSGRYRLRPDESGFEGLVLAGDWTDCGLNIGCIEAAAVSGLQAANAVLGHDRWDGISGQWEPLDRR